jgi:transcriptional regulator with XRE-family HTH domain
MVTSGSDKPRRTNPSWVTEKGLEMILRGLRERQGVTQKAIADAAEVSPAAITRLESGDRRPSRDVLGRLATVFGTTAEELIVAAEQLQAGEELDTVLDALPAREPRSLDVPAEVAGDYGPAPDTAPRAVPPPSVPASPPLSRHELQSRAAADRVTRHPDPDAAVQLLAEVADWIATPDTTRDLAALRREFHEVFQGTTAGAEPVAAMPTGEVRYVFPHAVGKDANGKLWIDPLSRARTGGYDDQDPRAERYDDGQVVLDISRLTDPSFQPRDHDRHRLRVRVEQPAASPEVGPLSELYARTVLEIDWTDDMRLVVQHRDEGVTEGSFPDGAERIHVITAANPRSRLLRVSENHERNRLLAQDLEAAGLDHRPAIGRSPDSSWSEPSFAVIDAERDLLLDLARRYEQHAIFEWTPKHRSVLWADSGSAPGRHGWSAWSHGS